MSCGSYTNSIFTLIHVPYATIRLVRRICSSPCIRFKLELVLGFAENQFYILQEAQNMERIATRTVDELGRIVLPSELRAKYGWGEKDKLSLYYVDSNTLMLQLEEKYPGQKCVFCGTTEAAKTHKGKDICECCLEEIKVAG